jgi:hypothetical protein
MANMKGTYKISLKRKRDSVLPVNPPHGSEERFTTINFAVTIV